MLRLRKPSRRQLLLKTHAVEKGSPYQKSKIVRLGLLRKPIAFRKPIAIRICNAKYGAFLQLEDRCSNLRCAIRDGLAFRLPPTTITSEKCDFLVPTIYDCCFLPWRGLILKL